MEATVVKKGLLYLQQQQTFGKKWRKFWAVLYRESARASAHLELVEGSGPPSAEKAKKAESSKRLIKLDDCVHVTEAGEDVSHPKETIPFLLETTGKCYLLAAEGTEAANWILELCKQAFSRSREDWKMISEKDTLKSTAASLSMAENSLYSPTCQGAAEGQFHVTVRATQASETCRLWGRFLLRAQVDALELCDLQKRAVLYKWPYKFLRRFGCDKVMFSFEAGRRCASGEGIFEFVTKQGSEIIQVIEAAIDAHKRDSVANGPCKGGSPNVSLRASLHSKGTGHAWSGQEGAKALDGGLPTHAYPIKTLSLESGLQTKATKGKAVKPTASCPLPNLMGSYMELSNTHPRRDPQYGLRTLERARNRMVPPVKTVSETEYADPFDSISKAQGSCPQLNSEEAPSPSASYGGQKALGLAAASLRPEHIYDDPDSLSHMVYDEPQEVKWEAWKLQAMAEDPVGHEYPYNPSLDDYSVPKMSPAALGQPGRNGLVETVYDNTISRFLK